MELAVDLVAHYILIIECETRRNKTRSQCTFVRVCNPSLSRCKYLLARFRCFKLKQQPLLLRPTQDLCLFWRCWYSPLSEMPKIRGIVFNRVRWPNWSYFSGRLWLLTDCPRTLLWYSPAAPLPFCAVKMLYPTTQRINDRPLWWSTFVGKSPCVSDFPTGKPESSA